MNDEILKLRKSKSEDDRRRCLTLLEAHLAANPTDVEAWYAKASCYDFIGDELGAEPCYRKSYEFGWKKLPLEEQRSFFVGYGSTLRNNLKFAESIAVLKEAIASFPDYPAHKVFLAFSYYSAGEDRLAAEILFSACLESAKGFDGYDRAISWYIENLKTHPQARP